MTKRMTKTKSNSRTKKKYVLAAICCLIVGTAVTAFTLRPRSPATIAEALTSIPEQFPQPQTILVPLSSDNRLGRRLSVDAATARTGTTDPASCFYVVATEAAGLSRFHIKYSDEGSMRLELGSIIDAFGIKTQGDGHATLIVEGVRLMSAIGIPNPNGPCGSFEQPTTLRVVTSQVVAERIRLTTQSNQGQEIAAQEGRTKSQAQWSSTSDGSVEGRDIVLSGSTSEVRVTVMGPLSTDLGPTPQIGRVIQFPSGFDGSVTITGYNDPSQVLTVRADVILYAELPTSAEHRRCTAGSEEPLKPGQRCYFWLNPGNAAIAVSWEPKVDPSDGVVSIVLVMKSYRTNFGAAPSSG